MPAKGRAIVVRSPRPIVNVTAPRPLVGRRTKRALGHLASRAAVAAREEKHRVAATIAAGLVGYAERRGIELPHIAALGTPATYGLGGWLLLKSGYIKSKTLSHAVTGLLAVAAYQYGAGKGMSGGVVLPLGR